MQNAAPGQCLINFIIVSIVARTNRDAQTEASEAIDRLRKYCFHGDIQIGRGKKVAFGGRVSVRISPLEYQILNGGTIVGNAPSHRVTS